MLAANKLYQALKAGRPSLGAWQMLPGVNLSRAIASSPNIDWICIDCEHGNQDDASMHASVAAIAATSQASPIVRIPANEPYLVKRALDTGAHGIIVPLLETREDAQRVVRSAKYPPRGNRGFGSPLAVHGFPRQASGAELQLETPSVVEYLTQANDALLTIVQIETREALENVDAIAAVEGIDVLFVGPMDLGNNIGHPVLKPEWDNELTQAVAKVLEAAKRAGKPAGIYCTGGKQAKRFVEMGFQMVSVATDATCMAKWFAAEARLASAGTEKASI